MRIAALILLTALSVPAYADVDVFRGIDYKNTVLAEVNNKQWRVDKDGVSTFEQNDLPASTKQCKAMFIIEGVTSKPAPGTTGHVKGMAPNYNGKYTPENNEGHWSIESDSPIDPEEFKSALTQVVKLQKNTTPYGPGSDKSECKTP